MKSAPAIIPEPTGRKNHMLLVCNGLEKAIRGEVLHLNINIPSRYGKTEIADAAKYANFDQRYWCL